jgi:hypothetical protein
MSIEIEFVTQVEYMLLANFCSSNFMLPDLTIIYSDVSDIAAGACPVELKSNIFHKMWNSVEKVQCSTWREMKAIELALSSFKDQFQGIISLFIFRSWNPLDVNRNRICNTSGIYASS